MTTETGGPAFPAGLIDPATPKDVMHPMYTGMTLRDYFAAKALQGMIANGESDLRTLSQDAYILADAMLKARDL